MSVELVITDPGYRSTLLDKWFEEDHYTQMNGVSHDINKKARVYPYIPSLEGSAEKRYIDFSLPIQGPIYIVYLDGRSDSGLPHTRGTSGIALPVFLLWNPSEKTLHHELVHISQKQVSKRWWNWYKIYWNFRPAKKEEFMMIPLKWRSRRRINPDLLGTPYTIWSDRYIPMSVFLFHSGHGKSHPAGYIYLDQDLMTNILMKSQLIG